jgi:hypothetical protein
METPAQRLQKLKQAFGANDPNNAVNFYWNGERVRNRSPIETERADSREQLADVQSPQMFAEQPVSPLETAAPDLDITPEPQGKPKLKPATVTAPTTAPNIVAANTRLSKERQDAINAQNLANENSLIAEEKSARLQNDPELARLKAQNQMSEAGYNAALTSLQQAFGVNQEGNKAALKQAFEGASSLSDAQIKAGQQVAALAKIGKERGGLGADKIKAEDSAFKAQGELEGLKAKAVKAAQPVDSQFVALARSVGITLPPGMKTGEYEARLEPDVLKMLAAKNKAGYDAYLAKQQLNATMATKKPVLTPYQEQLQQKTADKVAAWQAGDSAEAKTILNMYDDLTKDVDTRGIKNTVPGQSLIGGGVASFFPNTDTTQLQKASDQLVFRTLKSTLGSQFTQKENEELRRLAFSPYASAETNIKNLERARELIATKIASLDTLAANANKGIFGAPDQKLQNSQIKVINGVQFKRVPGGWEEL